MILARTTPPPTAARDRVTLEARFSIPLGDVAFSVQATAEKCLWSESYIRARMAAGTLPYVRIGHRKVILAADLWHLDPGLTRNEEPRDIEGNLWQRILLYGRPNLRLRDVARALSVSPEHLLRLTRQDEFPARQNRVDGWWFVPPLDFVRWILDHRVAPLMVTP